jgi:hypothetical protein
MYHIEQLPRIVKMSIRHTITNNGGYNCPHFTMVMLITSINYTQANEDVTNIIGCTALPRNANTLIDTTTLPVDLVVK